MTDSEKGMPPSESTESEVIDPIDADTAPTPTGDVPEAVVASDPTEREETVAEGEPVEVLAFVPPGDVAVEPIMSESFTTPEPDDAPEAVLSDGPVEELAFVPAEPDVAEPVVPAAVKTTRRVKPAVKVDEAPSRYAVIKTGGKQYRVKVGDRIQVERLHAEAGADITLADVLMLGGAGATLIGTPVVDGASVTAHVDEHGRGEKIVVFKFKAKKRYRRRTGHRQELTRLTITGISG